MLKYYESGTYLLDSYPAAVMFDSGATHSFVSRTLFISDSLLGPPGLVPGVYCKAPYSQQVSDSYLPRMRLTMVSLVSKLTSHEWTNEIGARLEV